MWNCILAYSETCGSLFKNKKDKKNLDEQEKESIIRVRVGQKNPSLGITICHHSASLVMPNGDPRDGFFYPTLTLMIDFYVIVCKHCSEINAKIQSWLDEVGTLIHHYMFEQSLWDITRSDFLKEDIRQKALA